MSRRRRPVIERNEGRQRLLEVLADRTQKQVATKVGASQSEVSLWASGKGAPDYFGRVELARAYGIALDAWEREAGTNIDRSIRTAVSVETKPPPHAA